MIICAAVCISLCRSITVFSAEICIICVLAADYNGTQLSEAKEWVCQALSSTHSHRQTDRQSRAHWYPGLLVSALLQWNKMLIIVPEPFAQSNEPTV
ncbi:hypothetical protein XELAEV_18047698mg [Xenopus laevis]|uniref:Secreted protein n=1 Tax=Xenopus laevis TaxID=8355 RepID=A0A974H1N0_XENLA|nr:hypothetical protein XELAEV_18047698mg [Xenopus laevis]